MALIKEPSAPHSTSTLVLYKWDELLSDALLGFLAMVTLFLAITPFIFTLSKDVEATINFVENLILVTFLAEYLLSLLLAPDKKKFVLSFWRILDAFIILIGFMSLLPAVGDQFKHALSLRLLRFIRIALFSAKIRSVITTDVTSISTQDAPQGPVEAVNFTSGNATVVTWETIISCLKNHDEDWLFAGNIQPNNLNEVADILKVPHSSLSRLLFESQFPRIERMDKYTTLFVWLPSVSGNGKHHIPMISRDGILLVGSDHNILVLARKNITLTTDIMLQSKEVVDQLPLLPCFTWAFLKTVIHRYTEIIDLLEKALLKIDAQQKSISDKEFLDSTFKLRSELTRVRSNVKHLSQAIRQLSEKPISIKGFAKPPRTLFTILFNDADSLYDSVDDLLNNLSALVDLRLNISSFQMNKVMRLLAILTTLTLIPAITGGMLGMNLLDNPWPLTLAEVSFCVAAGMSFSLYIFAIKGWFR
ncbi:CorA family divalent cation transporter [Aliiglaciecola litoralis]|uniref:Ion transport domain-containing protein n=1 Tax=Aliiglaciecola litoralis TaxID=582857 RepID=A0ABN1LC40_9ALTE